MHLAPCWRARLASARYPRLRGDCGVGELSNVSCLRLPRGRVRARRKGLARQDVMRPVGGVNTQPCRRSPTPHAGNGSKDPGRCCLGRVGKLPLIFSTVSSTRISVVTAKIPWPMTTGSGKLRSGGIAA